MRAIPTDLPGVLIIEPRVYRDPRGFFLETYHTEKFRDAGILEVFLQDNYSRSCAGTLRGLHFQAPPMAQAKLVRVSRGSIFDVAVDIRTGSPTYRQWVAARLSAADWNQMFVPAGFAHGFVTLEPDTEVQYKVSAPYSRDHDRAIRFDDPLIGVEWPIDRAALILSDKDRAAPLLAEIETGF